MTGPAMPPHVVSAVDQMEARLVEIMSAYTEANLTAQRGDFAEAERIMLDLMHQAEELEHPDMLNLFWTSVRMHYIDVWTWKKHMHDEHHGET